MRRSPRINGSREVAIDARWLHSGLGTYTYHLIAGFRQYCGGLRLRTIVSSQNVGRVKAFSDSLKISDVPIYTLREQLEVPRAAHGVDLLHIPHYNVPVLYCGKLVVSILDLIHITDLEYRTRLATQVYAHTMLRIAAKKACHVVTISQYSKDQIVQRLSVPSSKVSVIYCGVGTQFRYMNPQEVRSKLTAELSITRPYILYVGNLRPHKNLSLLLEAFAHLREQMRTGLQLIIVTTDRSGRMPLQNLCSRLNVAEATTFREDVTDDLLPWMYAGAECLVMPSRIEGFGLPVLEAMACGTPVVSSNAASLPEVGGEAAEYFDPNSVEGLVEALGRVLGSVDYRTRMRDKGFQQVARFSWQNSARQHCQLYRTILGS